MSNPETLWKNLSDRQNWRDYILPGRTDAEFSYEGWVEAQRLFYFFDSSSTVVDYGCGWELVEVQDPDDKVGNGFAIVICKKGKRAA